MMTELMHEIAEAAFDALEDFAERVTIAHREETIDPVTNVVTSKETTRSARMVFMPYTSQEVSNEGIEIQDVKGICLQREAGILAIQDEIERQILDDDSQPRVLEVVGPAKRYGAVTEVQLRRAG